MGNKKIILTGDRPTGSLHLGHYIGSLQARVDLQSEYEQYIMIADAQALTDHSSTPEIIRKNILEVALDYLAIGIDPSLSTIFIQSQIKELYELTCYFLNLVTWNRLKHNPTVKAEILQKNFGEAVPAGFMIYPIAQTADILAFKAHLVPVGSDQKPMLEQAVEIVRKFNRTYKKDVLIEPEIYLSKVTRLPGIDGQAKMSKTLNNAIFLSDPEEVVAKKVKKMYTDPNHLHVEDPGQVENNPVFTYLDAFGTDTKKIQDLKEHYSRGGLGDSIVKKYLLEVLQEMLSPIRQKRQEYAKDPKHIWDLLKQGTEKAQKKVHETMREVKSAMQIDYFDL